MAKIRYTVNPCNPTNHAERPLLVTRNAAIVEMSTMIGEAMNTITSTTSLGGAEAAHRKAMADVIIEIGQG
jgi:hypothetical protein